MKQADSLAVALTLALVLSKLDPETLLCVRNPLHCVHGNLELTIAKSADADSRDSAQPFEHPKITFRHGSLPSQVRRTLFSWFSSCCESLRL
jgi:hypothetical protein